MEEMNPDKLRKRARRQRVIKLLGYRCVRCGFADERALHIDHIHGLGTYGRRRGGHDIAERQIIVWGDGRGVYQLLCANCNAIKRREKGER
jgi:hypothetical protein